MEEDGIKRLTHKFEDIKHDVRAKDIVGRLFQDNVISADDMERVQLPILTTADGMEKLILILFTLPGSFDPLCKALRNAEYGYVADYLLEVDVDSLPPPKAKQCLVLNPEITHSVDLIRPLLEKLTQQGAVIDRLLLQRQRSVTHDSHDGKPSIVPLSEMPDLKNAMEENNLTEKEMIGYIEYLGEKRLKSEVDDMPDSATRRRSVSASAHNFTEAVASTTAVDIITFLASGENGPANPPKNKYEATMRRTVTELITKYRGLFESYINRIKEKRLTGIDFLFDVADEIFGDGQVNWGRIAALYAFCGWLAKHNVDMGSRGPLQTMEDFVGYYVSQKLGKWIDDRGGWDSFVEQFPEGSQSMVDYHTLFSIGMVAVAATAIAGLVSRS